MDLTDRQVIYSLLSKYNLFAKKSFGQNFLTNKNVLQDILNASGITKDDTVIEIGPGLGVLTKELAKTTKKVISIELDKKLLPLLKETLNEYTNIEILSENTLKFIPPKIQYKIVANIPYNITSPILNHFLQTENQPISMTLMVQEEVAEKICTLEPDMTVLSLEVALFGKAKTIKKVPASSFHPQPKVNSAIIHVELFTPQNPNYIPKQTALKILQIAKTCFSNRRKQLKNTLPKEYHEQAVNSGIDLSRRPETLSIQEWATICPACISAQ